MVVAFYFRLHLAYFPRPVVAIFARPEQYCKKVDGYYVSPGVFLLSNTRLITISAAENTAVDFCLPEKNR